MGVSADDCLRGLDEVIAEIYGLERETEGLRGSILDPNGLI
jgi:hypothetical protein